MDSEQSSDESSFNIPPIDLENENTFVGFSNKINMKIEPSDINDIENLTPDLITSQPVELSYKEDSSSLLNLLTQEQESRQPLKKKRILTEKQRQKCKASKRIDALCKKHIEHKRARQKMYVNTPEKRDKIIASCRLNALTEDHMKQKRVRQKEYRKNNSYSNTSLSQEQIEYRKAQRRQNIAMMTQEQRDKRRAQNREYRSKMTPEDRKKINASRRLETLTQDQIIHAREKQRAYRSKMFPEMRQKIRTLEERRKITAEQRERKRLQCIEYRRIKKQRMMENALVSPQQNISKVQNDKASTYKRRQLTEEQREHRRLHAIQYRLNKKKKQMDGASIYSLDKKNGEVSSNKAQKPIKEISEQGRVEPENDEQRQQKSDNASDVQLEENCDLKTSDLKRRKTNEEQRQRKRLYLIQYRMYKKQQMLERAATAQLENKALNPKTSTERRRQYSEKQRERKRLYAIQYRLYKKQQKSEKASTSQLDNNAQNAKVSINRRKRTEEQLERDRIRSRKNRLAKKQLKLAKQLPVQLVTNNSNEALDERLHDACHNE